MGRTALSFRACTRAAFWCARSALLPQRQRSGNCARLAGIASLVQQLFNRHREARSDDGGRRQRVHVPAVHSSYATGKCAATVICRRLKGPRDVAGDASTALEDFVRRARHAQIQLGARTLGRDRVILAGELDVIADAEPRHFPFLFVAPLRQRLHGRAVHLGKGTARRCRAASRTVAGSGRPPACGAIGSFC